MRFIEAKKDGDVALAGIKAEIEKNVSTLRSYGLIEGKRGTGYVAQPHLFLEAVAR